MKVRRLMSGIYEITVWMEPDEYEGPEPDPSDKEPDHLVTHRCGHTTGYWGLFLVGKEPQAADLCPDCRPCAECGQKLSDCKCFHDPFEGV